MEFWKIITWLDFSLACSLSVPLVPALIAGPFWNLEIPHTRMTVQSWGIMCRKWAQDTTNVHRRYSLHRLKRTHAFLERLTFSVWEQLSKLVISQTGDAEGDWSTVLSWR